MKKISSAVLTMPEIMSRTADIMVIPIMQIR